MTQQAQMDGKQRLILSLGKFRVTERQNNLMKVALGGSTTMTVLLPDGVDVRAGDLLTLYTEVFYAKPVQPPIQ
jgi:hypothetical protein